MALAEQLCFVQFMHPGGEHQPQRDGLIRWNDGPHRRKFLRINGRYLRDGEPTVGPIEFWGEWEPESEVAEEIGPPLPSGPRRVWRPYYVPKTDYTGLQNTDPSVFERFIYTGCQQNTVRGPTQLRYLSVGSVVLFGSAVADRFTLDTVFVVRSWIDHDRDTYRDALAGHVPDAYWDVTLGPWYPSESGNGSERESYRLYFGATHDHPVEGMFSFFPCQPANPPSSGFARPTIDIPGTITPNLRQGKRLNLQANLRDVADLWAAVVEQVQSQSLALGVWAQMPPER